MHENHRERMRERFFHSKADGFASHELLEELLYFSIPRKDTNELAHRLIERFGSLRGVLEATPDELRSVEGVGEQSAFLLKLVMETLRRIAEESVSGKVCFNTLGKISEYFCRKFLGQSRECVYLMLLNNQLNLIECCQISEGSVNSSSFPVRVIAEKALLARASLVVLAHNHPDGLAVPSEADIELTTRIHMILDMMGVTLLEHVIVANNRIWPILKEHVGELRSYPEEVLRTDPKFPERFYDIDHTTWQAPAVFEKQS